MELTKPSGAPRRQFSSALGLWFHPLCPKRSTWDTEQNLFVPRLTKSTEVQKFRSSLHLVSAWKSTAATDHARLAMSMSVQVRKQSTLSHDVTTAPHSMWKNHLALKSLCTHACIAIAQRALYYKFCWKSALQLVEICNIFWKYLWEFCKYHGTNTRWYIGHTTASKLNVRPHMGKKPPIPFQRYRSGPGRSHIQSHGRPTSNTSHASNLYAE